MKTLRALDTYTLVNRRNRQKNLRRRGFNQRVGRLGLGMGAILGLTIALFFILLGVYYVSATSNLPSLDQIAIYFDPLRSPFLTPTRLYDRTGEHVLWTIENPGVERRYLPVSPDLPNHFSPVLGNVTVAVMDPSFWVHPGFTPLQLDPDVHPTLAQQLVYDFLLSGEPSGLRRSIRERLLAGQLTARFGRAKVLELYLNTAYYGHLAYGADEAAQVYLGKSASQLNLAEAALLAGIAQTPALNPIDAPDAARVRQRQVLDALLAGNKITSEEYQEAVQKPLVFQTPPAGPVDPAPAFTRMVVDQLSQVMDISALERGGLRIQTTLDNNLQQQVICTVQTELQNLSENTISPPDSTTETCLASRLLPAVLPGQIQAQPDLAASALVLDPQSGQILAMIGETTLERQNMYLLGHPPGTLLTPFIYLTGFTRGFGPASLLWDIPGTALDGSTEIKELDGQYHGPVSLRTALANNYLIPAANLLGQLGPQDAWHLAESFGLPTQDLVQGKQLFDSGQITLVQAAQAYSVLANRGIMVGSAALTKDGIPHLATVLRVDQVDQRAVLDWSGLQAKPVVSEQLAYLENDILSDETARWASLGHPNAYEVGRPAAVQSGQTSSGKDTWSIGYTPQRLVAVWVGTENTQTLSRLDYRPAAAIWHALIQYATRDLPALSWDPPAGISTVEVCDPSGLLPTASCPNLVNEVFLSGNEPSASDDLYQEFQINRETGLLATVFTPPELVEDRVYLMVPPEALEWARNQGLPVPPKNYDTIQPSLVSNQVNIGSPAMFTFARGKVSLSGTAQGTDFDYYRIQVGQGLNPQRWIQIDEDVHDPVSEGTLAIWDTEGMDDGLYAVRLLVVNQDQHIDSSTIQVTVDNTAPQIQIDYPKNGNMVQLIPGQSIVFRAEASDQIGVDRVDWYVDSILQGSTPRGPFLWPWSGKIGEHTVQAKVYDRAGNSSETDLLTFTATAGP